MYIESLASSTENTSSSSESWQDDARSATAPIDEQQLIESHLHLVRAAVARIKRTVPAHIDADDLYSIGLTGLVSAVRKFNPIQGRTFAGFAALRIRGAMLDELRRLDTCSRRARARARELRTATNEVEQRLGREATADEVRASLGLSASEYAKWVDDAKPVSFLAIDRQADGGDGTGPSLHDSIADEQDETGRTQLEKAEMAELLTRRIAELPSLQKQILSMYYFENARIGTIAQAFGVTSSRISQVHTRTLHELRQWLTVAGAQ
jgi:RNA polymerase sigma factor for flagellar operon FliA